METEARDDNPAGMSVRKRNGSREPVHVDKIVRARGPLRRGPRRRRHAGGHPHHQRSPRGHHHLRARPAVDRHGAALTAEEPDYSRFAARLLAGYIEKEVWARTSTRSRSRSAARPTASSPRGRRPGGGQRVQARPRRRARPPRPLRVLRPAHVYDRYLIGTRVAPGHRDAAVLLPAGGLRPGRGAKEAIDLLPADLASSTCPRRRRCSTAAPTTSRCRRASCSIRPGRLDLDLRALHRRGPALEVSGGIGVA